MKPDAPQPRFEIWAKKFDGTLRFYMRYPDRPTAELVADRLRELGLPCSIRENYQDAGEFHARNKTACRRTRAAGRK